MTLCRIYEMEFRLDTPMKFRHPCYEALTWFAAKNILSELKGIHSDCQKLVGFFCLYVPGWPNLPPPPGTEYQRYFILSQLHGS